MNGHTVVIDGHTYDISKEDLASLDLISLGNASHHLLEEGRRYQVRINKVISEQKIVELTINGQFHRIKILDPTDRLIKRLGLTSGITQKINQIMAPMPGLVLSVLVEPGMQIAKNDPLLVLEAMKMENLIVAMAAGTIKSITVKKGSTVDKGEVLIEME